MEVISIHPDYSEGPAGRARWVGRQVETNPGTGLRGEKQTLGAEDRLPDVPEKDREGERKMEY